RCGFFCLLVGLNKANRFYPNCHSLLAVSLDEESRKRNSTARPTLLRFGSSVYGNFPIARANPQEACLRNFSTPRGRTARRILDGEHTPGCAYGTAIGSHHVEFSGTATDSASDRYSSGERVFSRRRGPATRALLECGCAPTYLPWPWCIAPSGGGTLDPFGSASTA